MLDSVKVGKFIAIKRKEVGLTQQQLAEKLDISFQAVSKWENGAAYPNIEILYDLAIELGVTVDEVLVGNEKTDDELSYSKAGIDISYTDSIKSEMSMYVNSLDSRVLNGLGPFASLYDINFPEMKEPVLVLKCEEPGSKQKLAMEYGYTESICHDMINHLVNDIVVMGAKPLAVLDTIVCGNAEKDTIKSLVKGVSEACSDNECSLVGGETSIQPHVVEPGVYVLTSSITGGGIEGNLCRVVKDGLCAEINKDLIRILPIFKYIKAQGKVNDNEMLRTFNMGVGFILVVPPETKQQVIDHVNKFYSCYEIGKIKKSTEKISFVGRLNWM